MLFVYHNNVLGSGSHQVVLCLADTGLPLAQQHDVIQGFPTAR